jgi:hypothetical protein
MKLTRRTFLAGAGATIALPFLESAAWAQEAPGKRLLFYYVPNGIHMPAWTPAAAGPGYELTPILQSLAPLKDKLLVLSGLANSPARPDGPGDHAAGTGSFLTCAHVFKTEGANIQNGISVDQVAAASLGGQTAFPSVQLGVDGGGSVGNCDSGYSCAYARNISWAGPSTPLPKVVNPQLVFDRLFAGFDTQSTAEDRAKRRRYRSSVLDYAAGRALSLQGRLGVTDRAKLDEYLTSVRALELRIAGSDTVQCIAENRPDRDVPFQEHARLMSDLMVLAFQCDQTRIISFMLGNAGSGRAFPFLGVSDAHHSISHHQNQQANFDQLQTIDTWEVEQLAYLLSAMDAVDEGEGSTLLDNSLVFFSSEIEDGNAHRHSNLPVLLAGGGDLGVNSGRHVVYQDAEPIADLFISMLEISGVPVDSFGDNGTGPLAGLTG